jgi:large subunit ribosomal protein L10
MRPEKIAIANEIKTRVSKSDYVFLVDYRGMKVEQFAAFRTQLRETQSRCTVIKNSYFQKVVEETLSWKDVSSLLEGPTAMVYGRGDASVVAKLLKKFNKDNNRLPAIKGGRLGTLTLQSKDVDDMAQLPPREVMLARLVGTIAAPLSQLVGVMQQKVASIVYVVKAIEEKKKQ